MNFKCLLFSLSLISSLYTYAAGELAGTYKGVAEHNDEECTVIIAYTTAVSNYDFAIETKNSDSDLIDYTYASHIDHAIHNSLTTIINFENSTKPNDAELGHGGDLSFKNGSLDAIRLWRHSFYEPLPSFTCLELKKQL